MWVAVAAIGSAVVGGSMASSSQKSASRTAAASNDLASELAYESAQDQLAFQQQMYDHYWEVAEPYERAVHSANTNLVPFNEALAAIQMQTETALTPLRAQAQELGLKESMRDLEQSQAVKDKLRDTQLQELDQAKKVNEGFFQETAQGVNVKDRLQQASADISQQFGTAREELQRQQNPFRRGNALGDLASQEARSRVAAATQTRRGAEAENFQKLATAKESIGRASGLAGTGDLGAGTPNALGVTQGQTELGNYQMTNPISAAQGAAGNAASLLGARQPIQPAATPGADMLAGVSGNVLGTAISSWGSRPNMAGASTSLDSTMNNSGLW